MKDNILDQDLNDKKQETTFKTRPVIIWGIITFLAIFLRIMHFPGGVALLLISSAALHAHCLVGFIKPRLRNVLNTTISIIGTVWFLTILGGVFFNNGYPYNKNALVIYLGIILIYFTIYYLLIKRKENKADTI